MGRAFLQRLGGVLNVRHPIGTRGSYAAVGCDKDNVRQFPDAPLLDEWTCEGAVVAEACIVDCIAQLCTQKSLLVCIERIADELYFLALRFQFPTQATCSIKCTSAATFPCCPERYQQSLALGLADAYGSMDSVARDIIKAEDIVDYTHKIDFAERFARQLAGAISRTTSGAALRAPQVR